MIAWLNKDVLDAVFLCPSHESPASELKLVVSPESRGVALNSAVEISVFMNFSHLQPRHYLESIEAD